MPDAGPARIATATAAATAAAVPSDGGRALLRRVALGTALTDAACLLTALLAAYQLRFGLARFRSAPDEAILLGVAPLLWVAVFAAYRLYGTHRITAEEELRHLASATTIGMALLVMASYWAKAGFSRLWLALAWVFAVALEGATRAAWRRARERLAARGRIALRTLVVGANDEAGRIGDSLRVSGFGYCPVGYVGNHELAPSPNGLPVVGSVATLAEAVRATHAQCLFVAASAIDAATLCEVARLARRRGLELIISSRLPEILSTRLAVQRIGAVAAISVMPPRLTRGQAVVKRAFDLAVATALLVLALPLMVAIAVAIRLDSRGGVLFRQPRVTTGGRTFTMLKFRTMRPGADAATAAPFSKHDGEGCVTRAGRVLRRWSLDELPQLLNVLRGDMTLVGPRPLPVEQVRANVELLGPRHEVPAGMTGWWQVRGRSGTSAEEAVRLDQFYVENWSLAYDLYILLQTVGAVLRGRGAV